MLSPGFIHSVGSVALTFQVKPLATSAQGMATLLPKACPALSWMLLFSSKTVPELFTSHLNQSLSMYRCNDLQYNNSIAKIT